MKRGWALIELALLQALLLPVRFYRRFLSPVMPPACRFAAVTSRPAGCCAATRFIPAGSTPSHRRVP